MNLENIDILKDLTSQEKDYLSLLTQERFIESGKILFKEGDDANSMYLLLDGELEVFIEKYGEKIVLGNIKAEEIIGEMALFGNMKKRMASAIAIKDSRLLVILEFSIKQIASKHPKLLEKIKNIIKKREEENKTKINM